MNWHFIKLIPFIDTRAAFVAGTPKSGAHLDIGSSDGETLRHMNELRSDIRFYATDIIGSPENYPPDCEFFRGDIQHDNLPWPDSFFDSISCLQLLEHLSARDNLYNEISRLLKPGGRLLIEIPHPKTTILNSPPGPWAGTFTINFYDDPTHTYPLSVGRIACELRKTGLNILSSGTSRNWLFALAYPFLGFLLAGRNRFTAYCHFIGWSQYLIAVKSINS
jgi:SAM-dependent methyltransferase